MTTRFLITGSSGFLGHWVADQLRKSYPRAIVFGASRSIAKRAGSERLDDCFALNVTCAADVQRVVQRTRPTVVVHLAAIRSGNLSELLQANAVGFENVALALEETVPDAKLICAGSAAELGCPNPTDDALSESAKCQPVDQYGVSKLAQHALAQARYQRGQRIVYLRIFNLVGPGVPPALLPGRCIEQLLARRSEHEPPPLSFGPLDTRRDYLDVRDAARAICLAASAETANPLFHIGSGVSRSGREIIDKLIELAGLSCVVCQRDDVRPAGVPYQTADYSLAAAELGWQPTIDWETSLRDAWSAAATASAADDLRAAGLA